MKNLSTQNNLLIEALDQATQQEDKIADPIYNLLRGEKERVANLEKSLNYQSDNLDALLNAIDEADIDDVRQMVSHQIALEADIGEGATILMYACGVGNFEIIKFLVELGANVNVRSGADFPLSNAAIEGHQEMYDYLAPLTEPKLRDVAEGVLVARQINNN